MAKKKNEIIIAEDNKIDNSKYLKHSLTAWNLPPLNLNDIEDIQNRVEMFFQYCVDNNIKPSIIGFSNYLGIDRTTLWYWHNGKRRGDTPEYQKIIDKAYSFIGEYYEQLLLNNQINPVSAIFLLKNHFAYHDANETVIIDNPLNQFDKESEYKAIEEKYKDVIIDDDTKDGK